MRITTRPPLTFCLVKGLIGFLKHIFQLPLLVDTANAEGQVNLRIARHFRPFYGCTDILEFSHEDVLRNILKGQQEFITTIAQKNIGPARARRDNLCHLPQSSISCHMPR